MEVYRDVASIVGLSKISMPRLEGLDTASARELRNYLYQMDKRKRGKNTWPVMI